MGKETGTGSPGPGHARGSPEPAETRDPVDGAQPEPVYDVIVIGAGPCGCEASLAAVRAGARTLCLSINLDNIALHPASPRLASGPEDPRAALLAEIGSLGAVLPAILAEEGTTGHRGEPRGAAAGRTGPIDIDGSTTGHAGATGPIDIDRRRVSLRYKELLESGHGPEVRQALVTSLDKFGDLWQVTERFGRVWRTRTVVVATGTYLDGRVLEAGTTVPGGRHGDIPSRALASCLRQLGVRLQETSATSYPRLDGRDFPDPPPSLLFDGAALSELYGDGLESDGDRAAQLTAIRSQPGLGPAWMMRSLFHVRHLIVSGGELDEGLGHRRFPGIFFSGRTAGSCNYVEAAGLGLVAGLNAAALARGMAAMPDTGLQPAVSIAVNEPAVTVAETAAPPSWEYLTTNLPIVYKLCKLISQSGYRPVTVRIEHPGC